jgi:hypothetical protein
VIHAAHRPVDLEPSFERRLKKLQQLESLFVFVREQRALGPIPNPP